MIFLTVFLGENTLYLSKNDHTDMENFWKNFPFLLYMQTFE